MAGVVVTSTGMAASVCIGEYRAAASAGSREAALRSALYCVTVVIAVLTFFVYWCFRCLRPVRPADAEWLLGQLSGSALGLSGILLLAAMRMDRVSPLYSDLGGAPAAVSPLSLSPRGLVRLPHVRPR